MDIQKEINDMILEFDTKMKSDIKVIDDVFNGKLNNDLTPDGLPTIEKQLRDLDKFDKELEEKYQEKQDEIFKRDMNQRVKCLCLNKMNKSIFTNTLNMKERERNELKRLMSEYNDIPCDIIINEFNNIVGTMFDDMEEKDYSKFPVYQH